MTAIDFRFALNVAYSFNLSNVGGQFYWEIPYNVVPNSVRKITLNLSTSSVLTTVPNGALSLTYKDKLCDPNGVLWQDPYTTGSEFHLGYTAPNSFRAISDEHFDPLLTENSSQGLFPQGSRLTFNGNSNIMARRDTGCLGRWLLDGFLSMPYGTANWTCTVETPKVGGGSTTANYSGTTGLRFQFAPYRIVSGQHDYNHQFYYYDPAPGSDYPWNGYYAQTSIYYLNSQFFAAGRINRWTSNGKESMGAGQRGLGWGIKPWNTNDPFYGKMLGLWNRASGEEGGPPGYYLQCAVSTGPMNIGITSVYGLYRSKNNNQYKTGNTIFPLFGRMYMSSSTSALSYTKEDAGSLSLNLSIT